MRTSIYILLSLLLINGFYSCKKVDKDKLPSPGKREFLTSKVWLLHGIKNQRGTEYTDENNCNSRLRWKLADSGDFMQLEKCNEDPVLTGTWTLTGDELYILASNGNSITGMIQEINADSMALELDATTSYYFKPF